MEKIAAQHKHTQTHTCRYLPQKEKIVKQENSNCCVCKAKFFDFGRLLCLLTLLISPPF